ncbi:hypothetical protein [Scytonema sp. PRP1]|uniref:hypothetical protein n=1 Tax=Scytonema sp. PRP1 TaxID=3120513 RepID=UPI00300C3647
MKRLIVRAYGSERSLHRQARNYASIEQLGAIADYYMEFFYIAPSLRGNMRKLSV